MRDAGHDESDVLLKKMQAEVEDVYRTAQKDLQKKIDDYVGKFAKDDAKKQKLVANGKMSQEDYEAWKQKTMLTGKQYRQMLNTVSTDLTNADQIARSIINGYTPEAYAVGMNYGTYQIESGTTFNTNFTLYNRETVERLLRDDPQLLPMPKVNIPKDKAWNYKQVNRQLTQGILQGESMPKIAKRFEAVTPSKTVADIKDAYKKTSEQIAKEIAHKNKVAAIRNARTAVTGAENAGRMDSFLRAKEMGIGVKKQWLATPDGRTRDSHVELDLEVVELEENFSNGCEYPGDPGGDPAETYNCRCAMIPWLDRFGDKFDGERAMNLHGMTYDEWKGNHANVTEDESIVQASKDISQMSNNELLEYVQSMDSEEYVEFANSLSDEEFDALAEAMENANQQEESKPKDVVAEFKSQMEGKTPQEIEAMLNSYDVLEMDQIFAALSDKEIAYIFGDQAVGDSGIDFFGSIFENGIEYSESHHIAVNFDEHRWNRLTSAEQDGIYTYTSSAYRSMNNYLRGVPGYETPRNSVLDAVRNCTSGLDKCELKEDTRLYRGWGDARSVGRAFGISENEARQMLEDGSIVGQSFVEKGFCSTGIDAGSGWDKEVSMEIVAPAGTKGMYVDPISAFSGEKEVLLQQGTEFLIVGVREDYGNYFLQCVVVGQNPQMI